MTKAYGTYPNTKKESPVVNGDAYANEPLFKAVWNYIKHHKAIQIAMILAACCDCLFWLTIAGVI